MEMERDEKSQDTPRKIKRKLFASPDYLALGIRKRVTL